MAKRASKQRQPVKHPAQFSEQASNADEVAQLCNRIALLTFGASFAFVVGLVVLSAALASGASGVAVVAGSLGLLAAAGAALRARRLRSELRSMRAARIAPAPADLTDASDATAGRPRASVPRSTPAGRA